MNDNTSQGLTIEESLEPDCVVVKLMGLAALRGARANDLLLDIGGKFFALGPSGARGVDRL